MNGSPPRAWGRVEATDSRAERPGFTPTCMGKGQQTTGEGAVWCGSPPRAWGRATMGTTLYVLVRFTPTCVGKGAPQPPSTATAAVHPHVRGEGEAVDASGVGHEGSPPRAWGRDGRFHRPVEPLRFTPTCVGKGNALLTVYTELTVHPHVRGEGKGNQYTTLPPGGSPPRAWGRVGRDRRRDGQRRFTPTCVGKGPTGPPTHRGAGVHPHVRGEGHAHLLELDPLEGSPPRAWGRVTRK